MLSPPGSPIVCEGAPGAICRPLCRFSIKKGAYHLTAYAERTHRRLSHAITSSNSHMTAHTERAQRLRRTQYFPFFCFCPVLFGFVLCSQNRSYGRFENQAYGRFLTCWCLRAVILFNLYIILVVLYLFLFYVVVVSCIIGFQNIMFAAIYLFALIFQCFKLFC